MTEASDALERSLEELDRLQHAIGQVEGRVLSMDNLDVGIIESNMSAADVVLALFYGVLGAVVASSDQLRGFLEHVHDDASVKHPKTTLGKLLHHFRDDIDTVTSGNGGRIFMNRDGVQMGPRFHRVMRGHDPFSARSDNPFFVLTQQHGLLKGIMQVFRHLVGDTFSKQGLVIPFHSFFDYTKDGKLSNWLVTLTEKVSKQGDVHAGSAFNRLFSIHMQDILSQGLTWGLCTAHIKVAGIKDEVRASQIRLTAYGASFFTHATIGMARQGGVPYINWPTFGMMMKELYVLFRLNYKEIKKLEQLTSRIIQANAKLERQVLATGAALPSYSDGRGYADELRGQERRFHDLIDFMEGDET